jgi:hypothetical protein
MPKTAGMKSRMKGVLGIPNLLIKPGSNMTKIT